MSKRIDICIPTYKSGTELANLLEKIDSQTVKADNIFILDTVEDGQESVLSFDDARIHLETIPKSEFDHAATRAKAFQMSSADILVFMTMDAVPEDIYLLEKLVACFEEDDKIAVSYARQLPRENAGIEEQVGREFNYPAKSIVKSKEDIPVLGIKTFFCSDVCAAYRCDLFRELGGFVPKTIFNEDLFFAAKAVQNGYKINYAADAKVIHSHSYSAIKQFKRNFDNGVSQAMYREILQGVRSESEGKKLVKVTVSKLIDAGKTYRIPGFVFNCGMRLIGFKLGSKYEKLPIGVVKLFSDNKAFWK